MTSRPIWHAIAASSYIVLIVSGIFSLGFLIQQEDTIFIPIAMLSLLTFSVALMGYLFFGVPGKLVLEGKPQEAFRFAVTTLGFFAAFTAFFITAMFVYPYIQ